MIIIINSGVLVSLSDNVVFFLTEDEIKKVVRARTESATTILINACRHWNDLGEIQPGQLFACMPGLCRRCRRDEEDGDDEVA